MTGGRRAFFFLPLPLGEGWGEGVEREKVPERGGHDERAAGISPSPFGRGPG